MKEISKKIQAVLFYSGEEYKKTTLMKKFNLSSGELSQSLDEIQSAFTDTGLALITTEGSVIMTFAPETRECIDKEKEEAYTSKLSASTLETLSIIAYAGPISKVDVDFLRGVNSQFTLRRLFTRGLVEDKINPNDKRTRLLSITPEYLAYMQVSDITEIPNYNENRQSILNTLSVMREQLES